MPTAQHLRAQIEANLADRIPSALTPLPRSPSPVAPTGICEIDAMLHGGFPIGAISSSVPLRQRQIDTVVTGTKRRQE